jgi:hypothetical protein
VRGQEEEKRAEEKKAEEEKKKKLDQEKDTANSVTITISPPSINGATADSGEVMIISTNKETTAQTDYWT